MQENTDKFFVGIIFDSYLLNQEQWVKVLQLKEEEKRQSDYQDDVVYKSDEEHDLNIKGFVGVVVEGSNIGKIKFEYSKQNDDLQEGDLLELQIGKKKIFYQVVNAHTNKELLEANNERGIIEGEAIQLGERQNSTLSFQKFGWVPQINTPLFTANTNNETPDIEAPNYKLGIIPKTNFPSTINLNDAISHHIALLGVTGSGKSFLAREIINQLKTDTKIICVDFNKEFVAEITPAPNNIISDTDATEIATNIDWINNELDKFANNQDKQEIQTKQTEITDKMKTSIETFLSGNDSISIFELPDVSNTTGILDYTKFFFKTLFAIAKEKQQG
jgi:hypothetical protein